MTKDERSLLLFFESCAVEHGGLVDTRHMNDEDFAITDAWKKQGLVDYGRLASECCTKTGQCWVKLSDEAWRLAHEERRARYARINAKRNWRTTQEKRETEQI